MFVRPEVEVVKFEAIDVIATSTGNEEGPGIYVDPETGEIVMPDDEG